MSESQSLSAGFGTSCTVRAGGKLWCWGSLPVKTDSGELPTPIYPEYDSPQFTSISTGAGFGCGVVSNGSITCFGSESIRSILTPRFTSSEIRWKEVSVALQHACGIENNGAAYCWGLCAIAECGPLDGASITDDQQQTYVLIPNPPGGAWQQIATSLLGAGVSDLAPHTCAVKEDSSAWCWGDNSFGQLGFGSKIPSAIPQLVSGGYSWRQVCTGGGYSCGVTLEGILLCWGLKIPNIEVDKARDLYEIYGTIPVVVDPLQEESLVWDSVTCGSQHACAIESSTKRAYCWGSNGFGQLGNGSTQDSSTPVVVVSENVSALGTPVSITWGELSAGGEFTCGKGFDDNLVYCWGSNINGQLGLGSTAPTEVLYPQVLLSLPSEDFILPPAPEPVPFEPLVPSPEPAPVSSSMPPASSNPEDAPFEPVVPTPEPAPAGEQSSSTPIGAIVGGVVGGIILVIIAGLFVWYLIKRKRNTKEKSTREVHQPDSSENESENSTSQIEEGHLHDNLVCPVEEIGAMPSSASDMSISISDTSHYEEEQIQDSGSTDNIQNDGDEEGDENNAEKVCNIVSIDTFSNTSVSTPQVRNFDNAVIQKKLNFVRNQAFLSLHQMTKHFDRAPIPKPRKTSEYVSWYDPCPIARKEELVDYFHARKSDDLIEIASKVWDDGGNEQKRFLMEYVGKVHGLQMTCQVLDSWDFEKSKVSLRESCQQLMVIIEDIRPILWDLAMKQSPFHARRKKTNIIWDESDYLIVYKSVQKVLLRLMENVLRLVEQDDRYVVEFQKSYE